MNDQYYKSANTGNIYKYTDDGNMKVMYLAEDYSGDYKVGNVYRQENITKEPLSLKEDWYLLLPDGYRERALAAREKEVKENPTASHVLDNKVPNLAHALLVGFGFCYTPEGDSFWYKVQNSARTMDFSNLPPLPESPTIEAKQTENNKQMKQLPKHWYIKTLNPDISRGIQEQLFKLGYEWKLNAKTVSFTEVGCLFKKTDYHIDGFQDVEDFKKSYAFDHHV